MFNSILLPVDVAHESSWRHALPQAIELARAGGKKLTVITVVREMTAIFEGVYLQFQLERMLSDARQKLASIVSPFLDNSILIEQNVRVGSIGNEILLCAQENGCDLILMASHRPEMLDYLIGPNAAHVVQNANCSVLVLRRYDKDPR